MPRKLAPTRFRFDLPMIEPVSVWNLAYSVYPVEQSYRIDKQMVEDPFSPRGSGRVAARHLVEFPRVGWIDMGWVVTGEQQPSTCHTHIAPDPRLLSDVAYQLNMPMPPWMPLDTNGSTMVWENITGLIQYTVLGMAWQLAADLHWPDWSRWMKVEAKAWQFEDGLPVMFGAVMPRLTTWFE